MFTSWKKADSIKILENIKLNTQKCDFKDKNMEVAKIEYLKDKITDMVSSPAIKVSYDTEDMEQMTFRYEIQATEIGLESIKQVEGVKEETLTCYDTEVNIKTEIKDEMDVEEYGLSYEQVEYVKTEVYEIERENVREHDTDYMGHMTFRCDIPVNEIALESIKEEEGIKEELFTWYDTEVRIKTEIKDKVDAEEHGLSYEQLKSIEIEDYEKETENVNEHCKHESDTEHHHSFLSAHKVKDKSTLQFHFKVIYEGNVRYFKCQFCEYIAKRKYNLKNHFRAKHCENAELYHCFNCKYKTKVRKYIVQHCTKQHHKRTDWQRHSGDHKAKYIEYSLNRDRLKHDADEVFHCEMYDFKTKSKRYLLQHHRLIHDDSAEKFHCKLCDYKTKYKSKLLKHHKLKHDDLGKIFHCEICDFKTKYKESLLKHQRSKHDVGYNTVFYCKLCEFKTNDKSYLLKHKRLKHDGLAEVFHCEVCDYKTKCKSSLLKHHKLKHDDAAEIFHCALCDYKTKNSCYLWKHHKFKHDNTVDYFHCKLCDYKTKYKTQFVKTFQIKRSGLS